MIKVKLAKWLAIKNSISQEMSGTIKAETEKAVLFNGKAYAKETTHCLRCGRELTHPSSKLVGFGQVCCKKIGVYWPNKSELTDKELESVKAEIEEVTYKGWLPKSQIEIEGEYMTKSKKGITKIGLHARKLKSGTIKKKGVGIKSPYALKDLCKKVQNKFTGKWNAKKKMWVYPLEVEVVDFAINLWKKEGYSIEKTKLLKEWYENEKTKKEQLISIKAKDTVDPKELETDLAETLYDFQRIGTHFLSNTKGAILADDMGLGKTIQSLAAVDNMGAKSVLVVCPASIKLNWGQEIEKWLPDYNYEILSGSKEQRLESIKTESEFIITNYASIRQKSRAKENGEWTKVDNPIFKELYKKDWDVIIFDEAHRIKNRKSQQTKAAYRLCKDAKKVFHLTGTPIMNSPDEIWSLLHSLNKQKYSSFWNFVYRFCHIYDNGFGKEIGEAKNPKEFRALLKPYMLRRMKEQVIEDMPELTMTKQWVELEGKQLELYEQMRDRMVAQVSEMERVTASIIIAKIMRLKQIAVSQELLNPEPSLKRFKKSAKIKALMDIIDGSGDQRIVVFTQYQKAAELAKELFTKEGIKTEILHGGIDEKDRQDAVNRFQNGEAKIFVATIKAGGLGINLTKGSIAVFLDKDWTPANNNQAIDRLHRIGQEDNVTVVELLAKNTIEEYIEEMLENKQKMFDSLVEGKMTGKELLLNLFPDN